MTRDEYKKLAESTAEAAFKRCADKHIPELLRRMTLATLREAIKGILAVAVLDRDLSTEDFDFISETCRAISDAFTETYGVKKKEAVHAGA